VTIESVVSSRPAIEAAFCSAVRTTLAGSMTPALNMSTYSPVSALKPMAAALLAHHLDHDRAVLARVLGDLAQRRLEGA
jgi:hypothetical protein